MTWFDDAVSQIAKTHLEDAERLRAQGLPSAKAEGWQHVGLRQYFAEERHVLVHTKGLQPSSLPVLQEPCVVLWNGRFLEEASHLPAAVEVEIAAAPLSPAISLFDSLARSLCPNVVISIHETLSAPLAIYSFVEGVLSSMVFQAITLRVDAQLEAQVHLHARVLGENPGHLHCSSMHVEVAPGAHLSLVDASDGVPTSLRSTRAVVSSQATFERFFVGNPSGLLHEHMETILEDSATAHLCGLLLQQSLSSSVTTRVQHTGPHGVSSQHFRSGVFGDARVAVDITTQVDHDAADTDAVQESRHLLLGARARAFTIPRLIINTDDVRCKHGATVGHADGQQLTYMRARGIGEQRGRSLLAYGHLAVLLEAYPETLRPALEAQIRHHLLLS